MSWLARSLANSLRIDDQHDIPNGNNRQSSPRNQEQQQQQQHEQDGSDTQGRGVKEDLSELKETLTRQLWGVASFLAPPPSSQPSTPSHHQQPNPSESFDPDTNDSVRIAEIGGRFRTGISKLSNNKAVSEISKIASNFFPFESDGQDSSDEYGIGGAVGVTDEVLAFARNIAHHPETWLDFPLSEDEDMDDFEMSDAQQEHALAVEHFAPRLAALRIELCPGHMSEGYFWKIYFVLLHSRLNKHDSELLSTPQIMAARAMWMQELQKRTKPEPDWPGRITSYSIESGNSLQEEFVPVSFSDGHSKNMPLRAFAFDPASSSVTTDFETEKHPVVSTEMRIIDKSVIEEKPVSKTQDKDLLAGPSSKLPVLDYEDDGDDWPEEENSEFGGYSGTTIPVGNEEDVSFSDLEDDDDGIIPVKSKIVSEGFDTGHASSLR